MNSPQHNPKRATSSISTDQLNPQKTSLDFLEGEWRGLYRGHFDQVVRFKIEWPLLIATKITGDDHVPGGEVTFQVNLASYHGGRMEGEGKVAEREFRNPVMVPGTFTILNKERVIFAWDGHGKVEFRKDD